MAIITPSQNPKKNKPSFLAYIAIYPNSVPNRTVISKITNTTVLSVLGPIKNSPKIATKIPNPVKYPNINNVGLISL